MSYAFAPIRFAGFVIGAGFVTVALSLISGMMVGRPLPMALAVLIPVLVAITLESRAFALAARRGPDAAERRALALRMALWGTATLLGINIASSLALGGPAVLLSPEVLSHLASMGLLFTALFGLFGWSLLLPLARAFAGKAA